MTQLYFRGNRALVKDAIIVVVRSISGNDQTHLQLAKTVHTAVGLAALSDIKDDFVRKARGEVGEDGNQWPPLSPKTLAYSRRFGPGEKAELKRAAGLGRGHNRRGLLSAAQDKRWRQIFAHTFKRLVLSLDIATAKARAAGHAWNVLKREGAQTKLDVFGNRAHEILRDTGVLLNSLSPGELSAGSTDYTPVANQIFALTGSGVIIGTNVPYASVHQHGSKKKGIPARPFLPKPKAPQVWVSRWSRVATLTISTAIRQAIGGAA